MSFTLPFVLNTSVQPATLGGTGQSTYAVGDLLAANTTTSLTKIADVATGNALISGGVSTLPSWGKISLTDHVSGTLPVVNGGTGATTYTNGQLLIGNSTGNTLTKSTLTPGSGITITNGGGSITIAASGTQAVSAGGTGQTTYTNGQLLIGNTTGNTLNKATLTAGDGISITNGGGSITISSSLIQSNTTEFTTPGTTSYSVPAAAKMLNCIIQAGGGSGSGGSYGNPHASGAGGGAGLYRNFTIPITSSDTVSVTIGTQATGGAASAYGAASGYGTQPGETYITINSKLIRAGAGASGGGIPDVTASPGSGGSGGSNTAVQPTYSSAGPAGTNAVNGAYAVSVAGVIGVAGKTGSSTGSGGSGTSGGSSVTRSDCIVGGAGGSGSRHTTGVASAAGGQCQGGFFAGGASVSTANNVSPGGSGGASFMSAGAVGNNTSVKPTTPGYGAGGAGGCGGTTAGKESVGGDGGPAYVAITWF